MKIFVFDITMGRVYFPLLLSLLFGCTHDLPEKPTVSRSEPSPSPTSSLTIKKQDSSESLLDQSIRRIDFNEFTFPWVPAKQREFFGNRKELSVAGGRLTAQGDDEASDYDVAIDVEYHELTGDKIEDALVTVSILLPNRAMPSSIFVFTKKDTKVRLLFKYESGQRDVKGFKTVQVENQTVIVEEYNIRDSPICCPKSFYRTIFEWRANRFELLSDEMLDYPHPSRLPPDSRTNAEGE